jgi:HAD superfamily hydrolase (TIGR01509 family)
MGYPSLMESLNQDLIKLIDNLRHNYEISLLSDTLDVHIEYFSNVGLFSHFDHTFLSPILGISKHEGTSIYKSIAKTLTVNPNFILFIDDLPKNVSNAKMIGWKSIQYLNNEHLIKELASYGIKS